MARVAEHVVEERRRRLTELLGRHRYLPVADVAKRLGISEATARRDLAALSAQRKVKRTFGGAVSTPATLADFDVRFASFADRAKVSVAAKRRIAKRAMELVEPGMTLFVDAGTTLDQLAAMLASAPAKQTKGLQVVTHSLAVADRLAGSNVAVHLLAGRLLARQSIVLGPATVRSLADVSLDLALLGAEAASAGSVYNSTPDVVELQQTVAGHASRFAVCLDATKFGRRAAVRLLGSEEIDLLVTDAGPKQLREIGLDIPAERHLRA